LTITWPRRLLRTRGGPRISRASNDRSNIFQARSLTGNAFGMVSGRVAAMGLGFIFWLMAARAAPQSDVGFAAAVVSAMMLCTQFAQLGVGSAFISLLPSERRPPTHLLDIALTLTVVGSALVATVFLLVARAWLPELGRVSAAPTWTASFLAMCVFGTIGIVLDQVNVGLGRGTQVVIRTAAFGGITLLPLAVMLAAGVPMNAMQLTACWVAAGAAATAVGLLQLRRTVPIGSVGVDGPQRAVQRSYSYRPRWERALGGRMMTVGLANHLLTLCERAPGLILPIVVTELLSADATAVWYIVWMCAWVVFTAPVSVGIAQFAEASRRPEAAAAATRSALRASLLYAGTGAVLVAALANPVLHLLGPRYADAGVTPLRLLLLGVVPLAVVSAYYAQCRASGRLVEAIGLAAVVGLAAVAAPALIGTQYGLAGMALAWVAVQAIAAGWAGIRLWASRS
jgi:O-antigen/teichoic acid export membrane protein